MWCVLPRPDAMQLHISRQSVSIGLLTLTGFFKQIFHASRLGNIRKKLEHQDTSSDYLIDTQGLGPQDLGLPGPVAILALPQFLGPLSHTLYSLRLSLGHAASFFGSPALSVCWVTASESHVISNTNSHYKNMHIPVDRQEARCTVYFYSAFSSGEH